MNKAIALVLGLMAACMVSGIYGMIHNQISFTVAPEYFTEFKFYQFRLDPVFHNRWGASLVGWMASWWMGLVLGVIILPIGLIIPGWKNYIRIMIQVFGIILLITFILGIGALIYASITIDTASLPAWRYPAQLVDKIAFARAGYMHNYTYLGGLVGVLGGIFWIILQRRRLIRTKNHAM